MNRLPKNHSAQKLCADSSKPLAWQPPSELELEHLRWQMLVAMRSFKVAGLDLFFSAIVAGADVVQAYFEPRSLNVGNGGSAGQLTVLPFDASRRAASQASRFAILLPQERGLAGVAAFLHAAGLYFITSSMVQDICPEAKVSTHYARVHNQAWLEDALRALRFCDPVLGATLTAGMEMGDFGGCDPEQVARLITARRLANLRIEELWLPSPK